MLRVRGLRFRAKTKVLGLGFRALGWGVENFQCFLLCFQKCIACFGLGFISFFKKSSV